MMMTDGGYSLMMNFYDGYTCSIVFRDGTRFIVCGLGGESVDGRQCIIYDSFWMVRIRSLFRLVVLKYCQRVGEIRVRTYSRWP